MCRLIATLILVLASPATMHGDDSLKAMDSLAVNPAQLARDRADGDSKPPLFELTIERVRITDMQASDTVPIYLNTDGTGIGGFDIKLGLDSEMLSIVEVLSGHLQDSCEWDFFHAGQQPDNSGSAEIWQIVALADAVPDSARPHCYHPDPDLPLFSLVVESAATLLVPDTIVPIYFYWQDCTDNTLSGVSGDTVHVSRRVYDYLNQPQEPSDDLFPTRLGAPTQCFARSVSERVRRTIDLHNGGVEFRVALFDSISETRQDQ